MIKSIPQSTENNVQRHDDNCNGLEDDAPFLDLITTTANITNVLCNGQKMGKYHLISLVDFLPILSRWSNGMFCLFQDYQQGCMEPRSQTLAVVFTLRIIFEIKATSTFYNLQ